MAGLKFVLRPESFCIHRLPASGRINFESLSGAAWFSVTRTEDELSIVAPASIDPGPGEREAGWYCLQIEGPLDFGMVGILSGVASLLARENVSIFTVSTYNTDHIFVRKDEVGKAVSALEAAGHQVMPRRE